MRERMSDENEARGDELLGYLVGQRVHISLRRGGLHHVLVNSLPLSLFDGPHASLRAARQEERLREAVRSRGREYREVDVVTARPELLGRGEEGELEAIVIRGGRHGRGC